MAIDPEEAKRVIAAAGKRRTATRAKVLTPEELRAVTRAPPPGQTPVAPPDPLTRRPTPTVRT